MFFNGVSPANVTAQPFFEAALGGAGSAYCAGYSSCTAAAGFEEHALFKETAVSDIWNAMTKAPSWTLGRTVFSQPVAGSTVGQATSLLTSTSLGFGNYNALFVTVAAPLARPDRRLQLHLGKVSGHWPRRFKPPVRRRLSLRSQSAITIARKTATSSFSITCRCFTASVLQRPTRRPGTPSGRLDYLSAVHRAERQFDRRKLYRRQLQQLARHSAK